MKKAYLNPAIEFDSMDMADLMIASLVEKEGQITSDLSNAEETTDTSGNLSRRSIWDEEE